MSMAIDRVIITVMIIILIGKPIKVFETMFYPKTFRTISNILELFAKVN